MPSTTPHLWMHYLIDLAYEECSGYIEMTSNKTSRADRLVLYLRSPDYGFSAAKCPRTPRHHCLIQITVVSSSIGKVLTTNAKRVPWIICCHYCRVNSTLRGRDPLLSTIWHTRGSGEFRLTYKRPLSTVCFLSWVLTPRTTIEFDQRLGQPKDNILMRDLTYKATLMS